MGQAYPISGLPSGGAPLASPAFTGTPTAPTAAASTDTTQVATTEFTHDAIAAHAGVSQWLTIPITSNVPGGDSDTGVDLPLGALVVGAGVTVTTPDNMAVSAGFTGDATAWLSSILVDTAGFLLGVAGAGGGSLLHADSRFTPIFITAARRRVWLSALEQSPWRGSVHILYFNPPA